MADSRVRRRGAGGGGGDWPRGGRTRRLPVPLPVALRVPGYPGYTCTSTRVVCGSASQAEAVELRVAGVVRTRKCLSKEYNMIAVCRNKQ
eukprot:893318-Rhodomonas_salina.1